MAIEQPFEDSRTLKLRCSEASEANEGVFFPHWVFLRLPTLPLSGVSAQVSFQPIAPD